MYALRLAVSNGRTLPTEGPQHYAHHTSRDGAKITTGTADAKTWATRDAAERNAAKWSGSGSITRFDVVEVTDLTTWPYALHLQAGQAIRHGGQFREIASVTLGGGQAMIVFTDGAVVHCDAIDQFEARA